MPIFGYEGDPELDGCAWLALGERNAGDVYITLRELAQAEDRRLLPAETARGAHSGP